METTLQPISQPRTKRCCRSAEERRRIVEETLVPGTSVAIVARGRSAEPPRVPFDGCRSPWLGRLRPESHKLR
jgi:hypothetical protein